MPVFELSRGGSPELQYLQTPYVFVIPPYHDSRTSYPFRSELESPEPVQFCMSAIIKLTEDEITAECY